MDNYITTKPLETRINLHVSFSVNPQGWHAWLQAKVKLSEASSVIELGCGTGQFWMTVDQHSLNQKTVVLTDSSASMLEKVEAKFNGYPDFSFYPLNLNEDFNLPFQPDLLMCNHVLYHVDDPLATLLCIKRQVSDTTICVFATNGMDSMSELERYLPPRHHQQLFNGLLSKFTLQSGYKLVRQAFGSVYIYRYPDCLQINSVDPLLDYIQSLPLALTKPELITARELMESDLAEHGAIYISKDTGVLCNRPL